MVHSSLSYAATLAVLAALPLPVQSQASFATHGYSYVGCAETNTTSFPLPIIEQTALSIENCLETCSYVGLYAAIGGGCHCSMQGMAPVQFTLQTESMCDVLCVPGNISSGFCGGPSGATNLIANLYQRSAVATTNNTCLPSSGACVSLSLLNPNATNTTLSASPTRSSTSTQRLGDNNPSTYSFNNGSFGHSPSIYSSGLMTAYTSYSTPTSTFSRARLEIGISPDVTIADSATATVTATASLGRISSSAQSVPVLSIQIDTIRSCDSDGLSCPTASLASLGILATPTSSDSAHGASSTKRFNVPLLPFKAMGGRRAVVSLTGMALAGLAASLVGLIIPVVARV